MVGSALRAWMTATVVACATIGVAADTLYLRDGSRIEGELVRVDNGRVEFREGGGWNGRTLRLDLDEVRRIDFDDRGGSDLSGSARGSGGGRPQGLRERAVVVTASERWNDTGIEVRSGQTIYFSAGGRVRWGKNRQDGPAGENNSPHNPARPLPNRPGAALIGTVGMDSGDVFFIGDDSSPFRIRNSGRLYLGINDDVLTDNSGNFRVTVYY
jgi:hypothetical protein